MELETGGRDKNCLGSKGGRRRQRQKKKPAYICDRAIVRNPHSRCFFHRCNFAHGPNRTRCRCVFQTFSLSKINLQRLFVISFAMKNCFHFFRGTSCLLCTDSLFLFFQSSLLSRFPDRAHRYVKKKLKSVSSAFNF